jgi:hypothetical protein
LPQRRLGRRLQRRLGRRWRLGRPHRRYRKRQPFFGLFGLKDLLAFKLAFKLVVLFLGSFLLGSFLLGSSLLGSSLLGLSFSLPWPP